MSQINRIYTLGYSGVDAEALKRFVDAEGALLVDTRMTPYSKQPDWTQAALVARFGTAYVHQPALGNRNYKGALGVDAGIVLNDPEAGVAFASVALETQSLVLLCGCWDVQSCHRKVAAELIAAVTNAPIFHLKKDDLPAPPAVPFQSYLVD